MLLKGENIPSSEGFPGQEDSSVEERQVSAEPHAPHLFPLERFLVQPQGNVLAEDPQVHGKHALDLGTQPVDRIEETMGSRVLRVHRLFPGPGKAAAGMPPVVMDAGAGGYMSEKSLLRIACPCLASTYISPFSVFSSSSGLRWMTSAGSSGPLSGGCFPKEAGCLCFQRWKVL